MIFKRALATTALLAIAVAPACVTPSPDTAKFRSEMLDAYQASQSLFPYAWTPSAFSSPSSESTIMGLLQRLSHDFHQIERSAHQHSGDPGFRIALMMQQDMLVDIHNRFATGDKLSANKRLRALSANCITCHTRYSVGTDFLGGEPPWTGSTFEDQLAAADYLLASRQFDRAGDGYRMVAETVGAVPAGSAQAMVALKSWLVIQVRVKNAADDAADLLSASLEQLQLNQQNRQTVEEWIKQLRIPLPEDPAKSPLLRAGELLRPTIVDFSSNNDEQNLVQTLRATAILHRYLEGAPDSDERRKAEFVLALAYTHIPIPSFEVQRELYLEQCIRNYPGSKEAKNAFLLYQNLIADRATESSGNKLDAESQKKLVELKEIAVGRANSRSGRQ